MNTRPAKNRRSPRLALAQTSGWRPIFLRASGTQNINIYIWKQPLPTLSGRLFLSRGEIYSLSDGVFCFPPSHRSQNRLTRPRSEIFSVESRVFLRKTSLALWGIFAGDAGNAAAVALTMTNGGETGSFVLCFCVAADCPPERSGGNVFNGSISIALCGEERIPSPRPLAALPLIWPPGLHHPPVQLQLQTLVYVQTTLMSPT